jgi:hypothetical protein
MMTKKLTNKELRGMLLQMKKQNSQPSRGYLLAYPLLGENFRLVMQRAKRLAMVLHMVIFDRGAHIEFRTWKRGY